jgi:hypothetical protein
MGNTTVTPGGDYERIYSYAYQAEWQFRDAVASTDFFAEPFGPRPWSLRQGLLRESINPNGAEGYDPSRNRFSKPVTYLPVKRRNGEDQPPTLIISIQLFSPQKTQNKQVKIWPGTTVDVDVVNVLASKPGSPEAKKTLNGKLDANLSCQIEVKPSDVKNWLKGDHSDLKALVNDNLLDFRFKLNGVSDCGQPVVGQSQERLFLYCKKTIVFLPGLFGSELRILMSDGRVLGYPMFYKSGQFEWSRWWLPDTEQYAGILECDENGVPLFSFPKISLLMLHSFSHLPYVSEKVPQDVINPFTACHAARMAFFPQVPENFPLYTLVIHPYDWRADLTDAAAQLNQYLLDLQRKRLTPAPDTDDQVAVMGHSTGGVVIRRALGPIADADCIDPALKTGNHPDAKSLISLAFFLSVPFNGAPKALPVLMTGLTEPDGERMIPFLVPETLFSISLVMPIVYHLATTSDYGYRPASSPTRPPGAPPDHEADKAAFVGDALKAGLMPTPWFVKASVTDFELRRKLAFGADDWHQLVRELWARTNGSQLINATGGWNDVNWFDAEIKRRGLTYQYENRRPQPSGWNTTLANRAKDFHQASLKAIAGEWNKRSAIVFGIAKDFTFRQINLSKGADTIHDGGVIGVMHDKKLVPTTFGALSQPSTQKASWSNNAGTVAYRGGIKTFTQWTAEPPSAHGQDRKQIRETPWTLEWVTQAFAGDGTVPSDSQLAEAKNVAKLIPIAPYEESPKHMETTKAAHVWESLVLAMHRGLDVVKDDSTANQKNSALDQLTHFPEGDPRFIKDPPH